MSHKFNIFIKKIQYFTKFVGLTIALATKIGYDIIINYQKNGVF